MHTDFTGESISEYLTIRKRRSAVASLMRMFPAGKMKTAPAVEYENMILYKLHVRGYTKLARKMVSHKGTFLGLTEMIPYWKELGINAIELMPAYEFCEVPINKPKEGSEHIKTRRNGKCK